MLRVGKRAALAPYGPQLTQPMAMDEVTVPRPCGAREPQLHGNRWCRSPRAAKRKPPPSRPLDLSVGHSTPRPKRRGPETGKVHSSQRTPQHQRPMRDDLSVRKFQVDATVPVSRSSHIVDIQFGKMPSRKTHHDRPRTRAATTTVCTSDRKGKRLGHRQTAATTSTSTSSPHTADCVLTMWQPSKSSPTSTPKVSLRSANVTQKQTCIAKQEIPVTGRHPQRGSIVRGAPLTQAAQRFPKNGHLNLRPAVAKVMLAVAVSRSTDSHSTMKRESLSKRTHPRVASKPVVVPTVGTGRGTLVDPPQSKARWNHCKATFFAKWAIETATVQPRSQYCPMTTRATMIPNCDNEIYQSLLDVAQLMVARESLVHASCETPQSERSQPMRYVRRHSRVPSSSEVMSQVSVVVHHEDGGGQGFEGGQPADMTTAKGSSSSDPSGSDVSVTADAASDDRAPRGTFWDVAHLRLPGPPPRNKAAKQRRSPQPTIGAVLNDLHPNEASTMQYLSRMCILPDWKLDGYRLVFDTLDKEKRKKIGPVHLCYGLKAICGRELRDVEIDFVAELLDLIPHGKDHANEVTFEQFAMAAALSERIAALEPYTRGHMDPYSIIATKKKAMMMFFVDASDDCTLPLDDLSNLLSAGRVPEEHVQAIVNKLAVSGDSISFLDYLTYLPLFHDLHEDIVENPLERDARSLEANCNAMTAQFGSALQ